MKFLFDLFPVVLFFLSYQLYGFYTATAIATVASIIQIAILWFKKRRVDTMYIVSAGLIVFLGLTTLLLHNQLFFQWKPTAINWLFALVCLISHFVGEKPIIQRMMQKNIELPKTIWLRLNLIWVGFFTFMGAANLYVVYHFSMDTWVNFKLFGVLGLTILFIVIQAIYLARHVQASNARNEKAIS